MLSRLRTAHSIVTAIARVVAVVMLALVMLSALIPSGAFSASHACRMDCCAGKPPHEAGACSVRLPDVEADETLPVADATDKHAAHHGEMIQSGVVVETVVATTASSDHCHTVQPVEAKPPPAPPHTPTQQRQTNIAAQAFTTPCSAECAAAVLNLARVRRPREAAVLSVATLPRPPTFIVGVVRVTSHPFSSAERRRQSRPRAPPISPVNLFT